MYGNQKIEFKGELLTINNPPLKPGQESPPFTLVDAKLEDRQLNEFLGKTLIISSVPSLDTSTCALQTKTFNREIAALSKPIQLITVSLDLPFAQQRFLESENCLQGIALSDYKYRTFGKDYGLYIEELGLLARAVFLVDESGLLKYVEYVQNLSHEPDYQALLGHL